MWEVNAFKFMSLAGGTPKAWCEEGSGYCLLFLGWIETDGPAPVGDAAGQSGLLRARELGLEMPAFPRPAFSQSFGKPWMRSHGLSSSGWGCFSTCYLSPSLALSCVKTNSLAFGQVYFVLGTPTYRTSPNFTETGQQVVRGPILHMGKLGL